MDASIDTGGSSRSAQATRADELDRAGTEQVDATRRTKRVVRRWPMTLLRVTITLQALDAFLQPVFAGRFLSGDFTMLAVHRSNATQVLLGLSVIQVVVSVIAWRRGGAPGRVVVATSVLLAAIGTQVGLGFARVLGVHIPLGVLIIATLIALAIWVWRRPLVPARSDGERS